MMDRDKKDKLPVMQVGFIDTICMPVYQVMINRIYIFCPVVTEKSTNPSVKLT